jgi:hypothetical protein
MSKFVLQCDCDSRDFLWEDDHFECTECGTIYDEATAGKNLLEEEA